MRNRNRRSFRLGLGAALSAALVVALAACGSSEEPASDAGSATPASPEWQAVIDAAEKEGQLVLYTNSDGVNSAPFKAAWAKAYPKIQLVASPYPSGELTAKLDAEKGGGVAGADAITVSTIPWLDANLDRLVKPTGPALAKYWAGNKYVWADGKYVLAAATPLGAGVNTELLAKFGNPQVTTYKDLLRPEFKGAFGIVPGKGSPAAEQWWYGAVKEMGGDPAVTQLAALEPRVYTSPTALATDLASGEVAIGAQTIRGTVEALAAKGAPVKFMPLSPVISTPVASAIVSWAKHPNAAQVFQNWLLSAEGQIALTGSGSLLTALPLAELGTVPPTMQQIPADATVVNGKLTDEQKSWVSTLWNPTLKLG